MKRSHFSTLCAAALAAMLVAPNLQASRLEKAEVTSFREGHARVCAGCRIHFDPPRTTLIRLDRRPNVSVALLPVNVCSDPGVSLWFPEEGEHLAAFLNSQQPELK